jgi:hypothetical protein
MSTTDKNVGRMRAVVLMNRRITNCEVVSILANAFGSLLSIFKDGLNMHCFTAIFMPKMLTS